MFNVKWGRFTKTKRAESVLYSHDCHLGSLSVIKGHSPEVCRENVGGAHDFLPAEMGFLVGFKFFYIETMKSYAFVYTWNQVQMNQNS